MGTVYRETYTKPLPPDAELYTRKGERFARWRDRQGRKRTAKVTATTTGDRLLIEAGTYIAKYRDGSGRLCKVSTGCRSEDAARAVLGELERRAELVRANVLTVEQDAASEHQCTTLAEHVKAYAAHQKAKGCHPHRIQADRRRVECVAAALTWRRLGDMSGEALTRWLGTQREGTMTPANSNEYRRSLVGFANWCKRTGRLVVNPFEHVAAVDADPQRKPRALNADELRRLLRVARLRPLAEYGRETVKLSAAAEPAERSSRRTWTKAPLTFDGIEAAAERGREALAKRPDLIAELERVGRERALIYKMLVLTGLRKGELASLTVGQLDLDAPTAYATLKAADEKAGRGADVPLRADLAADLRQWVSDKLEAVRRQARATGGPLPVKLPHGSPLFNVPTGLLRILNRDAQAAGIPKRDDRGRTVCLHGMRHTFGTHLSKAGVPMRTAQAAMRHTDPMLTMGVYTDPALLDVAGSLDALPPLPLDDGPSAERTKATGTDARTLVPLLVPMAVNSCTDGATADKARRNGDSLRFAVSGGIDNGRTSLSMKDKVEPKGIEPSTSALRTQRSPN